MHPQPVEDQEHLALGITDQASQEADQLWRLIAPSSTFQRTSPLLLTAEIRPSPMRGGWAARPASGRAVHRSGRVHHRRAARSRRPRRSCPVSAVPAPRWPDTPAAANAAPRPGSAHTPAATASARVKPQRARYLPLVRTARRTPYWRRISARPPPGSTARKPGLVHQACGGRSAA